MNNLERAFFIVLFISIGVILFWSNANAANPLWRQVVFLDGTFIVAGPPQSETNCRIALERLATTTHPAYELKCLPDEQAQILIYAQ